MVFLRLFPLVALATIVYGQNAPISCPGVAVVRLGCFKSAKPKVSTPNLLFTQKVNYRKWDAHLKQIVCKCVAKRGKSNVVGVRNIGECRTGNLYAKEGSAPLGQCNTWGAKPCVAGKDCIGNTNTIFVYRIQALTTPKPKVTPKPTTKKATKPVPTTPINKNAPENLQCYSYSVQMKLVKPPPGKAGTKVFNSMKCSICKTIRTIFRCYPCYRSVHFVKTTTVNKQTIAHLVLRFGCKAAHLKPLIKKLQKNAIVKATCQDGKCPQTPILAQAVPGCTMATACPAIPACSVPACGVPVPPPPPPPPPPAPVYSCPVGCPSTCAPACAPGCCRSKVPKPHVHTAQLLTKDGKPLYDYSLGDEGSFQF